MMDSTGESQHQHESKEWNLDPETEYRFELDPGASLAIKLTHGNAEVFGAEIAEGKTYLFGSECKAAVFTWQGCTLQMSRPSTEYVSDETPMVACINLHLAFEQMRVKALRALRNSPTFDDSEGVLAEPPRVLILGPENAGKTTTCKILTNYAVRAGQDWCPMLVNVDTNEGGWTVPGTISACPVNMPIPTSSPANPLGSSATSAPTALTSSALLPLVYWFGHPEVRRNPVLMDRLIRNLGENITAKHDVDPQSRVSGLIVDTPSSFATGSTASTNDNKYALVKACIDAFKINVIVVVGHEKLNVEMQRLFGNRMSVVKIPKSGGVVELDLGYRERVQKYQIHNYVYGQQLDLPSDISASALGGEALADLRLSPISTVISFDDLTIYRIGGESMAPSSALPIGATRVVSEMQPVLVDPSQKGSGLLHAVLALLSLPNPDESERYDEEVLDLDVIGFLIVTALDIPNRKMTVLAPSPGSIAGRTVLVGSLEWQEQ